MGFKLPKTARISGVKDSGALFEGGTNYSTRPIRCTFLMDDVRDQKVLVSAPKRLFKCAVDRNLLKRRMREAYRLNRHILGGMPIHLALRYTSHEIKPYNEIEDAVRKVLEFLAGCSDCDSGGPS